jgi:acetylornithine deacetylase/succinyl-diaminopimelate desuccinylase-like protein
VLPAMAMAKISCRLVPDQTEADTTRQLKAYLRQRAPRDIRWELEYLHGAGAALADIDNPGVQAMRLAMKDVWGKEPHFLREGGSIGVVVQLQRHLKVDSVLCGFSLPDSDMHSPNENLHLPTWYKGIETLIRFFSHLA